MKTSLNSCRLLLAFALASTLSWAEEQRDLSYGFAAGEVLKLDLGVPDGPGPFPVCILVHGGGFGTGDKRGMIKPLGSPLLQAGYAWASINYRLAPAHRYPASVEDLETAVRWVKTHAAEYRLDPTRIILMGGSAGGYLVNMVGTQNRADTRVAAVVNFYGAADQVARFDETKGQPSESFVNYFGVSEDTPATRKFLVEASPVTYVRPGLPPFLLLHGNNDKRVPYEQSVAFLARLKAAGVPAELVTIEGGGHGMGGWEKLGSDYIAQLLGWLDRTLVPPPSTVL